MKNKYTDSPEKKTIRGEFHDKYYLRKFIEEGEFEKYEYFGLPSVEFLDIICWKDLISKALGCEIDKDKFEQMEISRSRLVFDFPLILKNITIEEKIKEIANNSKKESYNLYNLDYCGGLFGGKKFTTDKIDNLRNIFNRHSVEKKNFVLSLTTNVRDTGKSEMNKFINTHFNENLAGCRNFKENLATHQGDQFGRYKIYFLGICYNHSSNFNFKQTVCPIIRYQSGNTKLIHFFQKFKFDKEIIQGQTRKADYINIANMPIFKFEGENNSTKKHPKRYPQLE